MSEEEITVLKNPAPITTLTEAENVVCAMSDQFESSASLDDETCERARILFDSRQFVEVVSVISFYSAVARFTNATRIPIESGNSLAGRSSPNWEGLRKG